MTAPSASVSCKSLPALIPAMLHSARHAATVLGAPLTGGDHPGCFAGRLSRKWRSLLPGGKQMRLAAPAEGNALALADALPRVPEQHTVPGGHFVFTDPCPRSLQAGGPECTDAPGTDRAAVLREVDGRIAAVLHSNL